MNTLASEILEKAMTLSAADRLQLAESLLSSIEPAGQYPFDADWLVEAKKRAADVDSGVSKLSSWPEVRDWARKQLEDRAVG